MNRIKELRKKEKITQQKLAELLDVSKRTIIAWENEEREIKKEKAEQIAEILKVSVGYLLGYTDNKAIYDDEEIITSPRGHVRGPTSKKRDKRNDLNEFISFLKKIDVVISNKKVELLLDFIYELDTFNENDYIANYFTYDAMMGNSEEIFNEMSQEGYSYLVEYIPEDDNETDEL